MHLVQSKPPGQRPGGAARRSDHTHRGFRILAGGRGDCFTGAAYAGKIAVFEAEAADLDDVARALRDTIDRDLAERQRKARARGWSSEDYRLALFLISPVLNPIQTHIIRRIGEAEGETLSLEQLCWPSGFSANAVLRALSRLAKMVGHALDGAAGEGAETEPLTAIAILAEGNGGPPWTFKTSFAAAARAFREATQ